METRHDTIKHDLELDAIKVVDICIADFWRLTGACFWICNIRTGPKKMRPHFWVIGRNFQNKVLG